MSDAPAPPTPTTAPPGQDSGRRRGARQRPAPNYAARRMLVTTVAIVAIVAFGVIGWTVVRGDDDPFGGSAGSWNEIALVDRGSGAITILDDEGEVARTIVGRGRVTEVHAEGDRMALVGSSQVVVEGGESAVTIPIDRGTTVTPIRTDGGLDLVVGRPAGGNVLIIDVMTGEVLDIGALAKTAEPQIFDSPLLFAETLRWSADAETFAVADASSFQTIVVRKGSPDVSFFRSQPVAVGDERVATSQIVGGQSDLELYDHDRESKARVPLPIPAGGVMVDSELRVVTIEGGIHRVRDGDREAERLAAVAVPSGDAIASVRPVQAGDRLVVSGGAFEALVDLDGATLFTTTFTTPVEPMATAPTWSCVPIGGGSTFHSIVATETGDQLADLSGVVVTGTASDGCTVLAERAGLVEVIGPDGAVSLGRARSAVLGPDGRTVVRVTTSGVTELLRIEDDLTLADPVDLGEGVPANALVAFLD